MKSAITGCVPARPAQTDLALLVFHPSQGGILARLIRPGPSVGPWLCTGPLAVMLVESQQTELLSHTHQLTLTVYSVVFFCL